MRSVFRLFVMSLVILGGVESYHNETINLARILSENMGAFQRRGRGDFSRGGRFISFDAKNDDVKVGLEFSVPFISIPVKKSISAMKSMATSPSTFLTEPLVNINTGAVALTGTVVLAGAATALIWKSFMKDQIVFSGKSKGKEERTAKDEPDDPISNFIGTIERVLMKYDIDATACTQKLLCDSIKSASQSVTMGKGSSSEKIFDGITSSSWVQRATAGTAIHDALLVAKTSSECERKFYNCKIKPKKLEEVLEQIVSFVKY